MMDALAVMQPYFFPYIGYFQLALCTSDFVFYDDVQFIKGGWINRNRILVQGAAAYINVPMIGASPNKRINEIESGVNDKYKKKVRKTLQANYSKAPFFKEVSDLVISVLDTDTKKVSEIAIQSVLKTCKYLGIENRFHRSSEICPETTSMDREERLTSLIHQMNYKTYINVSGGKELYNKNDFQERGIDIQFIGSESIEYSQLKNDFVPWLSIIDVMMFNSPDVIKVMLTKYSLE